MENLNKWTGRDLIKNDGLKIIDNPIQLEYEIGFRIPHTYLIVMEKTCYCATRGFGRIIFDPSIDCDCESSRDCIWCKKIICTRHDISGTILKFLS